jgi:small GTP-binding protein
MALKKIPQTVGLNSDSYVVAKIQQNSLELILWDLGGKEGMRNIWNHYYPEAQIIMFLIDGADRSRFEEAREVFSVVSAEVLLESVPILFLVNKHDQGNCASLGFIKEYFKIDEILNHKITIMHISALSQ